jgi:hypothetical protein
MVKPQQPVCCIQCQTRCTILDLEGCSDISSIFSDFSVMLQNNVVQPSDLLALVCHSIWSILCSSNLLG